MKIYRILKKEMASYVLIVFGALLASFSVACILLPNDAIDYGTAGIAIIISKTTGWKLSVCVVCVVLPFLIGGAIYLGRQFIIKAILGSAAYTIGIECFEEIHFTLNTEHFLAVAFGGAILGAGLSLILRFGGCIDGSEILANIILKKLTDRTGRNYSMNMILILFNVCVYSAAFILINRSAALLSLLVYVVATIIIDHFTDHFEAIKQVRIITKHPEEMVEGITKKMGKTCTIMDSYGAIAGENKTVICYVNYFELQKLREIIDNCEQQAFTTISTIDEIIR
ncbi:MAG: YitT family protein [Lachnospiraceae bacterium]|nr:YitT family protein [Lachnospiraceae bacterium]